MTFLYSNKKYMGNHWFILTMLQPLKLPNVSSIRSETDMTGSMQTYTEVCIFKPGSYRRSRECTKRVQQYLHAAHDYEIIFTRGTTESINLVASSFGDAFLKDGDEIILSEMEHHANIVPWQLLQNRKKITLRVVPIDENGELKMDVFRSLFNEKTKTRITLTYL